jgi:RNA polymerase sigma-70 factor (ECF subfamily)
MALGDETSIIRRCQRGDRDAFATLYRRYERQMFAVAFRMLHGREEAEDALHDAFLGLYRRIGQFRFESAFSTWFYRIVVNTCLDRLKRRRRTAAVVLDEAREPAGDDATELRVHLERAIAELPPRMKVCFVLFAQEGFKQREIAAMLDMKLGTVKVHVFEARARLREALAARLSGRLDDELR